MEGPVKYLVGVYDDEDVLLSAVKDIREAGVNIYEAYTPYPVHGLEYALGYKRTRISIAAFIFGMVGTTLALTMQFWMMGVDWQMIIGGKNFAALPTFIPVTFELTVLLGALGMVATFLVISDLKPYKKPRLFHEKITDDKHVIAISLSDNSKQEEEIRAIVDKTGSLEINEKTFSE